MLKHLRDIESDMSAFHRIDNIWAMDGPRFFYLAYRLTAYRGVMRSLAERQAEEQHKRTGGREVVSVASGELNKIEGLGAMVDEGWLTVEKAT